jgi:hypothetical protein
MVVPATPAQSSSRNPTVSRLGAGHPGILALRIGSAAIEQFFAPGATSVEFELDHLRIVCPLEPSFWLGQGEIRDDRLSSWLQSKRTAGKLAAHDGSVAIIPCGLLTFRLQPVPPATATESNRPAQTVAKLD